MSNEHDPDRTGPDPKPGQGRGAGTLERDAWGILGAALVGMVIFLGIVAVFLRT